MNKNLISKYNKSVPRYTSYPPANYFSTDFKQENYINLIKSSNQKKPELIAFYVHIPFCERICFYCGCNTCSLGKGNQVRPYIDALKKEILEVSKYIDKNRLVSQIHYGGGTPNSIRVEYLAEINNFFFDNFQFVQKPEIAIECNPAHLTKDYIDDLKKIKFNRFSIGIQDFNDEILKNVNRKPSFLPVEELVSYIRKDSEASVNMDFIYGLPGQNVENFTETIKKAIEIKPDRLVTFSYAHVPWLKKHQQILEKKVLPNADEKSAMFYGANKLLKESGYKSIGFDHYVLLKDNLFIAFENNKLHRNFQGYCTRETTGQVYAFGVSSISQLSGGYAQNTKDVEAYISLIQKGKLPIEKGYKLTDKQEITKEIITDLMCNFKLNWQQISDKLGVKKQEILNAIELNNEELKEFQNDSLIEYTEDGIDVTEKGVFFIRNIAASIDPEYQPTNNKYSKSV